MARTKVASEEAILATAVDLFERKGYQNTTVDDIAESMGIAKPTIYKYVKSKSAILQAIFNSVLSRLRANIEPVRQFDRPEEQIDALVQMFLHSVHDLRSHFLIFFGEERELPVHARKRLRAASRELTHEMARLFEHAQRAGVVRRDVEPSIAAYLVSGMLASVARWYSPEGRLSHGDIAEQAKLLLQGFYTGKASRVAHSARHIKTVRASV